MRVGGTIAIVVGDEDARARASLVEMQVQLSQGPHIALQVAEMATAEQIRRAFLELTKQYHPARFARMASDIQKLANEVFLGIRSAHDSMLRALGASTKPGGVAQTGGVPIVHDPGTSPPRRPAQGSGGMRPTSQIPPLQQRPGTPPGAPLRPTPSRGMSPQAKPPTPAYGVPVNHAGRSNTPPQGIAIPRTMTPGSGRHQMPVRPTPMPSSITRPLTPNNNTPSPQRVSTPRGTDATDPGTLRYAGTPPTGPQAPQTPQRTAAVFDERTALREALDLMSAQNWTGARTALHQLAARVPQSKQYRALLCYARGREAQGAGKVDDAALEFQRALQLDPDLVQAKLALAEIKRR